MKQSRRASPGHGLVRGNDSWLHLLFHRQCLPSHVVRFHGEPELAEHGNQLRSRRSEGQIVAILRNGVLLHQGSLRGRGTCKRSHARTPHSIHPTGTVLSCSPQGSSSEPDHCTIGDACSMVYCEWIGNTPSVASKHYAQTMPSNFDATVNGVAGDAAVNGVAGGGAVSGAVVVQNAVQSPTASNGHQTTRTRQIPSKKGRLPRSDASRP